MNSRGFTIVELLIVIVVIGILAAISFVAYNGVQDRAKASEAKAEVAQLAKAMHAAKLATGKTLVELTTTPTMGADNTGSGRACWALVSGTDLSGLSKTSHNCWLRYFEALQIISDASGVNVRGLIDPWNRPYYIDQSEGEDVGGNFCIRDKASTYRLPFVSGSANDDTAYRIFIENTSSGC